MKNPYQRKDTVEEDHVPLFIAKAALLLFLLILLVPPVLRHFGESKKESPWYPVAELFNKGEQSLREHLQGYEAKLKEAGFREPLRRIYQGLQTKFLGEGNRKTLIGSDGRLYLRTAVQSLTGYGPLQPEPDTVAKDPNRAVWKAPAPVIASFAQQLKERGIELILVPVPVKPMIYPEGLGEVETSDGWEALKHPDADRFYQELRSGGVKVIDLADALYQHRGEGELFLKQDTHWTPFAMKWVAKQLAPLLSEHLAGSPALATELRAVQREHLGDLVEKLDYREGANPFSPEVVELEQVVDAGTGEIVEADRSSPVVLLGDSFVSVFHSPNLGFADSDNLEAKIGAGFAQHLMHELGHKIDVIAINGKAATGVRRELARRPDDELRQKKVVLWLVAARDLFLSETAANEVEVIWENVEFNPQQSSSRALATAAEQPSSATIVVEATVLARSASGDPSSTPYKESLYAAQLQIDSVVSGSYQESEALVYFWAFRDSKLLPSSDLQVGQKIQLRLTPWSEKEGQWGDVNRNDDLGLWTEPYFGELVK